MGRFFVTGGSGFVGTHLVQTLLDRGGEVVVYQHSGQPKKEWGASVRVCTGDVADAQTLADSIASYDPDTIFHLAGNTSKAESLESSLSNINAVGTCNIVHAVSSITEKTSKRIRLIVLGSLDEVVGSAILPINETSHEIPISVYGFTKLIGTKSVTYAVRTQNLNAVVLRASLIYGPGQTGSMFIPSCMETLARGEVFHMSSGEQKRDLVYVHDVIDALVCAHERQDCLGVVNIAYGDTITMGQVATQLESAIGHGCIQRGALPLRPGEVAEHRIAIEKAQKMLDWSPKVSPAAGIAKTVNWFLSTR